MAEMKNLAKDTAIYGVSTILGKFLNWLLVPFYSFKLANSAEYGIVTNLYAWTALLLVILTYGMETGFFRFVNKKEENPTNVYSTVLLCVGFTSLLFAVGAALFSPQISAFLGYADHPEYITMLCGIVALDAFGCIPFAYLRYQKRPMQFALLKFTSIIINISFNLFFFLGCPFLMEVVPQTVSWFYEPDYGAGYVFISNVISTASVTLMLLPQIMEAKWKVDRPLLKRILRYSLPLLVLGIAGIMNQTIDKILFPFLVPNGQNELGIYGACFKIAMVMMVFTQGFRYAYEPFVFAKNKGGDKRGEYADAMKFFVIFSLLICLGMVFYIDILKYLLNDTYWSGLKVVPIVLLAYLFQGTYFNLSIWYKLLDKTHYGAYFSFLGLAITLAINLIFVPEYGYMASAAASLVCFIVVTIVSYIYGQKYYPIDYDLKSMLLYTVVAAALYLISRFSPLEGIAMYAQNTALLMVFLALIIKRDLPLSEIPVVNRFCRKR